MIWSGDPKRIQNGNPHQLVRKQHIFPRKCIERFYGASQKVEVLRLQTRKSFAAKSSNAIFCAQRAWGEDAEKYSTIMFENPFQQLADLLIGVTKAERLSARDSISVTAFFALWDIRSHLAFRPLDDQTLVGIQGPVSAEDCFSQDQGEKLEKHKFILSSRVDGAEVVPGRMFTWPLIKRRVAKAIKALPDRQWTILISREQEFFVPDFAPQTAAIPLSPTHCLVLDLEPQALSATQAQYLNDQICSSAQNYLFYCPRRDASQRT